MVWKLSRLISSVLIAALIMTLLASCTLTPEEESLPPPIIPREKIAIKTVVVERGDIGDYEYFSGAVTPVRQHNIYLDIPSAVLLDHNIGEQIRNSDTSRRIKQIIEQKIRVKKGDILAVFTNKDLEAKVALLQRTLELARIDYDAAVKAREIANSYYLELEKRSENSRQEAEDAYAAAQISYEYGEISAALLKKAEIDYENTLWQLNQDLQTAKLNAGDDAVRREKLNLTTEEENLREVKEQIESLVLRAPLDGVITYYCDFYIGETYNSDQLLFTVAEESTFYITVALADAQVRVGHPFRPGTEVEIKTRVKVDDDWLDLEFAGQVISASPDLRSDAGLNDDNTIVIDAPNWPQEVGLGASGIIVNVPIEVRHNVVVIPLNAVYMAGSNYRYVRVVEDGVSKERPVQLGLMSLTEVEIISGLEPGEEIAVR